METDARNRIMYGMPLSIGGKVTLFSIVNTNFMKCNFVIEESCTVTGMVQHHIESMSFCVNFLTKKRTPEHDGECIWISGEIMNTILAHPEKKFKFVHDRKIIMKTRWVDRGAISQGNKNFSQFMSQM